MKVKSTWRNLRQDIARLDTQFYSAAVSGLILAFNSYFPTWFGTGALAVFVFTIAMIFQHFAGKRLVGEVSWEGEWTPAIGARLLIMAWALYAAIRFL